MNLNDIGKTEKPVDPRSDTSFLREALARLTGAPKILVVEDSQDDLDLTLRLLEKFQCSARGVTDSHQALGILQTEKFDLIFCDAIMPRLSGMAVLNHVKHLLPETKFIMVTGHTNSPMVAEVIRNGGITVWEKPLSQFHLEGILKVKI